MIVGLGVDIVEIARIRKAMEHPRFLERVLTPMEREFCFKPSQVAGRWAAKEAVAKAIGLHLTWQEVEVLPDELGVPRAVVRSPYYDPSRLKLHVTISHERTNAIGIAVLERVEVHAPYL
jgi:holo-[acyl-carrier protein] synthase